MRRTLNKTLMLKVSWKWSLHIFHNSRVLRSAFNFVIFFSIFSFDFFGYSEKIMMNNFICVCKVKRHIDSIWIKSFGQRNAMDWGFFCAFQNCFLGGNCNRVDAKVGGQCEQFHKAAVFLQFWHQEPNPWDDLQATCQENQERFGDIGARAVEEKEVWKGIRDQWRKFSMSWITSRESLSLCLIWNLRIYLIFLNHRCV